MSDSVKGGIDFRKLQDLFVLLQQYGPTVLEIVQKLTELLNRPSQVVRGAAGDGCENCDHLDCAVEAQLDALAHLIRLKHGEPV